MPACVRVCVFTVPLLIFDVALCALQSCTFFTHAYQISGSVNTCGKHVGVCGCAHGFPICWISDIRQMDELKIWEHSDITYC